MLVAFRSRPTLVPHLRIIYLNQQIVLFIVVKSSRFIPPLPHLVMCKVYTEVVCIKWSYHGCPHVREIFRGMITYRRTNHCITIYNQEMAQQKPTYGTRERDTKTLINQQDTCFSKKTSKLASLCTGGTI